MRNKVSINFRFFFSFNFTLCKWRNTWSVNHSKIKDISFSLYEEILISLHFFFPQIWWRTILFEIYINKYTCQNLNYWMNIAHMMPELMLLFEEPSTLSERMIVCSWLITIMILTILWCELYRFWILSDLKNRYGPWFFLQASLFVKIQAKRELEEPMIRVGGRFRGMDPRRVLWETCAIIHRKILNAQARLVKWPLWLFFIENLKGELIVNYYWTIIMGEVFMWATSPNKMIGKSR